MTLEQTVEIPASRRLVIDVPREIPAGRVVLTFTPEGETRTDAAVGAGKPRVLPRFTMAQIEAAAQSPEVQAIVGALKGADLPPDVTMKDIREMRLAEKYGI
ncbi:hypothetical protein AGMMS49546_02740 [Spirochaetia bacterium]|nr:hypothetical protein AGMMS49546_02740 [Spirochaetia bacterium]